MRVMGIDISTKTGVAIASSEGGIEFTTQFEFKKEAGLLRASSIAAGVCRIKDQYQPDLAVIENYGFANAYSLATLVEIGTVVRYFLWQDNFPFHLVAPNALKKFVTGKGNAKKDLIILHVYKKWGFTATNDNIADAIVLAQMGLAGVTAP